MSAFYKKPQVDLRQEHLAVQDGPMNDVMQDIALSIERNREKILRVARRKGDWQD